MNRALEQQIRELAHGRCEYCLTPEAYSPLPFILDHVIAKQHGGSDDMENLAFCCAWCNRQKGPNIAGVDPVTGERAFLFHPRRQLWIEHFVMIGDEIRGMSVVGRATVIVLKMNHRTQLIARIALKSAGLWNLDV